MDNLFSPSVLGSTVNTFCSDRAAETAGNIPSALLNALSNYRAYYLPVGFLRLNAGIILVIILGLLEPAKLPGGTWNVERRKPNRGKRT